MSQYKSAVPDDSSVKPEIRNYYESFYTISDTPDAHEKYSEQFTKDAKLIMASNEVNGRDGGFAKSEIEPRTLCSPAVQLVFVCSPG